jgi:hypothetical protein
MGKVDPNTLVSKCMVLTAFVNGQLKSEARLLDSHLRFISNSLRSGNRGEALAAAQKYGDCQRKQEFLEKLVNAVRTIQDNAGTMVSSSTPRPELEEPLRMIAGNCDALKFTEMIAFRNGVLKDIYGSRVVTDLSNPTKLPPRATLPTANLSERDLILLVKEVSEKNRQMDDFAKLFPTIPSAPVAASSTAPVSTPPAPVSRTKTVQQPAPTPVQRPAAAQPPIPMQPAGPTKIVYSARGPDLNLINIPAFPREIWPRLVQQVREALA